MQIEPRACVRVGGGIQRHQINCQRTTDATQNNTLFVSLNESAHYAPTLGQQPVVLVNFPNIDRVYSALATGVEERDGCEGGMSDNRRELLSAVAAAAAASTADGEGDERLAEQYEGILAYVKRHSSR